VSGTPQQDVNQQLELEVNRLLRQLKHPPSTVTRASRPSVRVSGHVRAEDEAPTPAGVWVRVALGGLLAIAITQWPYSRACGVSLGLYLITTAMVMLVAGWTGISSWKRRMGGAHIIALCLGLWGVAYFTAELLPRVGYARAHATWMCGD